MYVKNEDNNEVNLSTVDNDCSTIDDVSMNNIDQVFQKSLASAFIKCNLTHTQ